jgi:hypothetical protein
MSQTLAIILKFRADQAGAFEAMFRAEILPLWEEFFAHGKFIEASLTPIQGGVPAPQEQRHYILHVEVPGVAEHEEFDQHPQFLEFLPRAKALQPEEPLVWFGTTLLKVGG